MKTDFTVIVPNQEFDRLLNEFIIKCDIGTYNMMDEAKWNRLVSAIDKNFADIIITYYGLNCEILVKINNEDFLFRGNAKASFGTFLYRKYFEVHPNEDRKEDKNMFKFDFGPAKNVKMSMYGLAVKNAEGVYVSYDSASGSIIDVDILNFDAEKFVYKMPVPISQIKVGDLIVHQKKMMFVENLCLDCGQLEVVDYAAGEVKLIVPTKNMFGFNYITKVVNLMEGMMATPNAENPFGNMWMLALADGGSMDTSTLAMMMLMNGQPQTAENGFNPMMFMLMDKDNSKDNLLPLMMMMNMNK